MGIEEAGQAVLGWIYPSKCALCDQIGEHAICGECRAELPAAPSAMQSHAAHLPVDVSFTLYAFRGAASTAVKRLKYDRRTSLIEPMARLMRDAYDEHALDTYEAIVPMPIHWKRRAERGFNQAEALCRHLPEDRIDLKLVRRIRNTTPQAELSRAERLVNLRDAFQASPVSASRSVLIVDDVMTTGGTGFACAQALKDAGAGKVALLAFCGERDTR